MALKALKNTDNKICVDSNGNILLVDAGSQPGPGPEPVVGGDFVKNYSDECLLWTIEGSGSATASLVAYSTDYLASESIVLMRPFEAIYNTPCNAVGINDTIVYGAYLTEIGSCSTLNNVTGWIEGFGYPPAFIPTPDVINALGSTLTLNLDGVVNASGLGSVLTMAAGSSYNINLGIPEMFYSVLEDKTAVYTFFSRLGVDLSAVIARQEAAGHTGSSIFEGGFQNVVLNLPNCLSFQNEGFDYYTKQITVSFNNLQAIESRTFTDISLASVYINSTVKPQVQGMAVFGDTGTFDLYVPSDMVAQYQADSAWNATNIYAYEF